MNDVNNSLMMRALRREPVPQTPIWLMRQAGRYLPEYRKIRAQVGGFMQLCQNKELACEVTLQPLRRFALDAGILFSDILTIPDAMGLGVYFAEGEGPRMQRPLHSAKAIEVLEIPDVEESLHYVFDAVTLIRQEMPKDIPLIGFSGSPWTLACYMVEGQSQQGFPRMIHLLASNSALVHVLLEKLTKTVILYLEAQVKAGADILMLFDTWGGLLSTDEYLHFSLAYMRDIVSAIKKRYPHIPIILFTKGGGQWLKSMAAVGCDALGIDWTCDLALARRMVGQQVALQGNLEPAVLLTDEATIRQQVRATLASFGTGSGHIFNLGHGITPEVPPRHVQILVDAVRAYSPSFHY